MVRTIATLILFLSLFAFSSCTKSPKETGTAAPAELRIFTWSQYFDDDFLRAFGERHKVKVKADYYSSNEEMLAKLQLLGAESGYDLILPSDYMVRTLIELKMLRPLEKARLPVLADFDPEVLNPSYDPGLSFSVPLALGTTGVAVNTKLLPTLKTAAGLSWREIFENPAYRGKVTLLDDTKEVLQVALLIQGKKLATATEAEVKAAFEYLKRHKSQIKGFPPETMPVMEAGECGICMAYSGDALTVAKEKKEFIYVLPNEGTTIWTDNLAIPANAKNVDVAYIFINELLSVEGAKSLTERTGYRSANLKAKAALPKEIAANPMIYPLEKDRQKMNFILNRKDLASLVDREWALLKSL
jgi:spermidine/putrescine transport system substrate-binding protein